MPVPAVRASRDISMPNTTRPVQCTWSRGERNPDSSRRRRRPAQILIDHQHPRPGPPRPTARLRDVRGPTRLLDATEQKRQPIVTWCTTPRRRSFGHLCRRRPSACSTKWSSHAYYTDRRRNLVVRCHVTQTIEASCGHGLSPRIERRGPRKSNNELPANRNPRHPQIETPARVGGRANAAPGPTPRCRTGVRRLADTHVVRRHAGRAHRPGCQWARRAPGIRGCVGRRQVAPRSSRRRDCAR